jgi:hypothetical protein
MEADNPEAPKCEQTEPQINTDNAVFIDESLNRWENESIWDCDNLDTT